MYTAWQKKIIVINVCIIMFINALSLGIVTPVFPELLLSDTKGLILDNNISRVFMYSLCVSVIPMASMVGVPIFGIVSNMHKRINVILLGIIGNFLSYGIAVIAIIMHDVWLFLFSRVISGVCLGVFSLSNILMNDISDETRERTYYFKLSILCTLGGSIVGPMLSILCMKIKLDNPLLHSLLVPYIAASCLYIISILSTLYCYKLVVGSSYKQQQNRKSYDFDTKFVAKELFNSVVFMFKYPKRKIVATVFVMHQFANGLFVQGLPMYLAKYLNYTPLQLSYLMLAISLTIMMSTYLYDKFEWLTSDNSYQTQLKLAVLFTGSINIIIFSLGHFLVSFDIQLYHHAFFWISAMTIYALTPVFKFSFTELFVRCVEEKGARKGEVSFVDTHNAQDSLGNAIGSMPQISQVAGFLSGLLVGILLTYRDILLICGMTYMLAFGLLLYYFRKYES
ncbi:MAG: transporter, family, tetracycline resistance protein [Pseudomonadota bacterium]|nr:transporter, family, tetracycline resistance protein [Pseudomonadota bacterium]